MISWISIVFFVISPFAFLIVLIWAFFSPHFSQICQGSVNLVYFFKEPAFCFIDSTQYFESICTFKSFKVYLKKLVALRLGAYRLIIVISLWCISPLISMECPLSHLINVSLKSTLSEISIVTPACFGGHWLGKSSSSLSP
jgi:hypothetical protein